MGKYILLGLVLLAIVVFLFFYLSNKRIEDDIIKKQNELSASTLKRHSLVYRDAFVSLCLVFVCLCFVPRQYFAKSTFISAKVGYNLEDDEIAETWNNSHGFSSNSIIAFNEIEARVLNPEDFELEILRTVFHTPKYDFNIYVCDNVYYVSCNNQYYRLRNVYQEH